MPWLLIGELLIGLPLALWTVKCTSIILFQRKVIYMPYFPLGARSEKLADYANELAGLECREIEVTTLRGIEVRNCDHRPATVLVYLQGNASTPLARIPIFRKILLHSQAPDLAIVAVAPRGYWQSPGRPTQHGLTEDYLAVVRWARQHHPQSRIVVHGHSIGASLAIQVLHRLKEPLDGLILECAFTSIPDMVKAMYPRASPYHWLGPFAFDRMDAIAALRQTDTSLPVLSLVSEKDELVPRELSERVHQAFDHGQLVLIPGAHHDTAFQHRRWAQEIVDFLARCTL